MHIFFSGIGGTGIGPLALIAKQAGHTVSGSDKRDSTYIEYLKTHGITDIHLTQDEESIAEVHSKVPIDWYVYSSAVAIEQPDAPEFIFCRKNNIRMSPRADFLNQVLEDKKLQMIAIAGTHGKSTTTAMAVWLFKQIDMPVSYSFGAKTSFSEMGAYEPGSKFFVYEADEFARNFLEFSPRLSIIVGIDYDHPDIYPTRSEYNKAFEQFINQSTQTVMWDDDFERLDGLSESDIDVLHRKNEILNKFTLLGEVNRMNALQVAYAVHKVTGLEIDELIEHLNSFPGLSRRFEQITPNLYSDYAHTPPKISGALQTAIEKAGSNVVVVYEGLHNTRQHFIKDELVKLFDNTKQLYIVPSYLAREDPNLQLLSPVDLRNMLSIESQQKTIPSELNQELKDAIEKHIATEDLVLCLSAGGGGSLDEWLRKEFK